MELFDEAGHMQQIEAGFNSYMQEIRERRKVKDDLIREEIKWVRKMAGFTIEEFEELEKLRREEFTKLSIDSLLIANRSGATIKEVADIQKRRKNEY